MSSWSEPAEGTRDVRSKAGKTRGLVSDGVVTFRGVPYADPPVGPLRFQPPRRRKPWTGTFEARDWGATPLRVQLFADPVIPAEIVQGEDVLNLNIFAPAEATASTGLPVMVWIHGGGYRGGAPTSDWFDGSSFARDGIIVVTISYRLGIDGFSWLEGAPPNRGVSDWLLALEWVQENIAAYGGDPAQVTIAGQSAGAGAVVHLISMPCAKGLFSRACILSGSLSATPLNEAIELAHDFAEALGLRATVESLGRRTPAELQEALLELHPPRLSAFLRGPGALAHGVGPVIDGELIVDHPVETLTELSRDIPVLIGSMADEFIAPGSTEPPLDRSELFEALTNWRVPSDGAADYLSAFAPTGPTLGNLISDLAMRAPWLSIIEMRSTVAAQTWVYDFRWRSPVTGVAAHCYEIPFFFAVPSALNVEKWLGTLPAHLVTEFHSAAVSFIKGEDPGWTPAGGVDGPARVFDTVTYTGSLDQRAAPLMLHPAPPFSAAPKKRDSSIMLSEFLSAPRTTAFEPSDDARSSTPLGSGADI